MAKRKNNPIEEEEDLEVVEDYRGRVPTKEEMELQAWQKKHIIDEPGLGLSETKESDAVDDLMPSRSVRHKSEWSDYEKQSITNIEKYKDAFGELLRSPLPGAVWRWENPDGTKTPRSSDVWASDSGFFFASEQAQKTAKRNVPQDIFGMSNILAKGNPGLADQVVGCRVCQRESYFLFPKTVYDGEGYITKEPTAQQKVCQNCQRKGIVREQKKRDTRTAKQRKNESDAAFKKRKSKMKTTGYKWDVDNIHNKIKPFNQTVLSDNHASMYNLGWGGEVEKDRNTGKVVRSKRVSRFLQGVFDF